jgi:hypothetical protein
MTDNATKTILNAINMLEKSIGGLRHEMIQRMDVRGGQTRVYFLGNP